MNMHSSDVLRKPASRVAVTNAFLRSVYNWMALGLALTAVISFALIFTPLNALIFNEQMRPIFFGCIIAELGLVFYLSARIRTLSGSAATGIFLLYSALNGVSLSFILIAYSVGSVAQAFFTATGMFAAMSLYGLYTKKDLTSMGSFMMMGLFGLIIAMVVNLFLGSGLMSMVISVIGVIIFLGLTAYDTQTLKEMGEAVPQGDAAALRRGTIMGALTLYLDFINIFLMLLRLFGGGRD